MTLPTFDHFNQKIADAMTAAHAQVGGLPAYLGIRLESLTAGRLTMTLAVREELITPMGAIHGGVMAGLVDHALGVVLYPLMEPGQWAATTEFKLNYMRAVRGGTLSAESTVLSLGRRSAVVRAEVANDGKLACVAQGTLLISDPPGKR